VYREKKLGFQSVLGFTSSPEGNCKAKNYIKLNPRLIQVKHNIFKKIF